MDLPHDDIDPRGLLEYSVVFTDRSLNHMSERFIDVMRKIVDTLRTTYRGDSVAIVPGGGSYAMEAVARQLATDRRCLIVRNGMFSYRWSQIIETGAISKNVTVCTASPQSDTWQAPWRPAPIEEVVAAVAEQRPAVVFAPHVETAAGMVLPDEYIRTLATAVHDNGGTFVLDSVASGALWVDMSALGVDVLITAPQKGWSGSPCAGYVVLNETGREAVLASTSTSFAANLKTWLSITDAYIEGRSPYHTTLPTDTLAHNLTAMQETTGRGLENLRAAQNELGTRVRALLADRGMASVAVDGFAASSVVVAYTDDPRLRSGARFTDAGIQVAAGVPLHCGEPEGFSTFRLGLFGLDKLGDVEGTVARFEAGLAGIGL